MTDSQGVLDAEEHDHSSPSINDPVSVADQPQQFHCVSSIKSAGPAAAMALIPSSPPPYEAKQVSATMSGEQLELPQYQNVSEAPPPYAYDWQNKRETAIVVQCAPSEPVHLPSIRQQSSRCGDVVRLQPPCNPRGSSYRSSSTSSSNNDHYMTVSLILTILCFFSCGYLWLVFTIPAFIFSSKAMESESDGDVSKARKYGRVSFCLNAVAIVSWLMFWAAVIICASSYHPKSSSSNNYYYHYTTHYS